jgi:hypothetical protein
MRHAGRLTDRAWNSDTNATGADYSRRVAHTDRVADKLLFRFGWRLIGPFVTGVASFSGSTRLELYAYADDEQVRYTLDGSEPTATSPACRDFVELDATTLVRARVFNADGGPAGLPWSQQFTRQKP